jgi:hypothetical protein
VLEHESYLYNLFEYISQKLLYYEHMSYLRPFWERSFEKHPVLGQRQTLFLRGSDGRNSQACLYSRCRMFVENLGMIPPSDVDPTNEFR